MTSTLNPVGIAEQIEKLETEIIETYNQIESHDSDLAVKLFDDIFTEHGAVRGEYLNETTLMILQNDLENVTTVYEDEEIV